VFRLIDEGTSIRAAAEVVFGDRRLKGRVQRLLEGRRRERARAREQGRFEELLAQHGGDPEALVTAIADDHAGDIAELLDRALAGEVGD
jgi:hypothetical protein